MRAVVDEAAPGALAKLNGAIARGATLEEVSALYADYILERRGGNKVHASAMLDVNRRTLQRWIAKREARPRRAESSDVAKCVSLNGARCAP
jgi:DNA-binding protein Fis